MMNQLLRSISRSIVVVGAHESPGHCAAHLQNSPAVWVIIERFLESGETYYYVLHRQQLDDALRGYEQVFDGTLSDLLGLHESDSNGILRIDGRAFHPAIGPGLAFRGRFASAAVMLDQGAPIGVLPPPAAANGGTREFGTAPPPPPAPAAPAPQGVAPAGTAAPAATGEALMDFSVGAEFPESLAVGETAPLTIILAAGVQELAGTYTTVALAQNAEVVIALSLSDNLRLATGKLSTRTGLPSASDDERVLFYEIEALKPGPARITVRLFQPERTGEQVGFLKLMPTVTREPVQNPVMMRPAAEAYPPSGCPPPDVVLYVEEEAEGENVEVRFRLTAGPNYPEPYEDYDCGKIELKADPAQYFHQRFARIEGMPFETDEHVQAIRYQLLQEGRQLYHDLLPAEIRSELEKHGHRITSVQIKTDGHHIPWEMIVLPPLDRDGVQRDEEFLSLRYAVTRWTERYSPPARIVVRNLIYVAPGYGSGQSLQFAVEEAAYLESLAGQHIQPKRVRARPLDVYQALDGEAFDVLHYVGHASQSAGPVSLSTLELETEEATSGGLLRRIVHTIEPRDLSNKGARWGERRPLVFLNACQTGRADVGLVRVGGWAQSALGSKAGAFVGTLWSVRDSAALLFARTFYGALISGQTFGASAQAARRTVAATGDPSWLAYVVYAHPNARVVIEGGP